MSEFSSSVMFVPKLARQLKAALEKVSCMDHRVKPEIKLSGNTMTIRCCCEEFHTTCVVTAQELAGVLNLTGLAIK
ncbi:MAG: hypothetical protein JSU01_11060 [Bacteroidetes bacterium]|nr:hypothetical protein [Bacteroidota bacterium]